MRPGRGAFSAGCCAAALAVVMVLAAPAVAADAKQAGKGTTGPKAIGSTPVQMKDVVDYERTPSESTHHMLRLAMGRSKAVHVDQPVASVKIDNPERIEVFVSGGDTLNVLARKQPGIAHFVAKGKDGKVVMSRDVVVGDKSMRYVRVRDACAGDAASAACGSPQLYFCPDQCFEMKLMDAPGQKAQR
jgi:hypothetical protein